MSDLTPKQQEVVLHYVIGLIRRKCLCYVRSKGTKCTRCEATMQAREAFPDLFARAADIVALTGPSEDF